ncbi:MAG: flagellar biosynthetic protein FliO, partial [Deltaproteobacteria bacterium]|nr:flagellar biosynthetic protein FliO [Deltaproteobacteria bacterium]
LPRRGLGAGAGELELGDEWITAVGLELEGEQARWYLRKRDPELKIKPFLALEKAGDGLRVVLLKEYRPWAAPAAAAAGGDKIARLRQRLDAGAADPPETVPVANPAAGSQDSLAAAALRSFLVLLLLAAVVIGLVYLLKRFRQGRGGFGGSGLVQVLAREAVSPKHQILLIDILGEVLVVGVAGEQMTRLATISDPERLEELRLLRQNPAAHPGFAGFLKGLLEREGVPAATPSRVPPPADNVAAAASRVPPAAPSSAPAGAEELPENYRDVVSQIKNRLKQNERGQ